MDKIGIITFHHAKFSYGAMLQAYATEAICRRFSDYVEIINYENIYEQKGTKTKHGSFTGNIRKYINYLVRMVVFNGYKNQYRNSKNIDSFYKSVSKKYNNAESLAAADYDILVSGSDQIWNPEITNGIDDIFLLNFGNPKKRISYASSMGSHHLTETEKEKFEACLQKFSRISVREVHAKQELQYIRDDIKVVLDPTLLLSEEEWEKEFSLKKADIDEKYILTFFVGTGIDSYWNEIEKYTEEFKLPIWNIQSHTHKSAHVDRIIFVPSVADFVSLIANAEMVITNSFHGTAFSINFKKNFIPILSKNNPARVLNLLEMCGLTERINIDPKAAKESIDYRTVGLLLEGKRKESLNWLEEAIKE